MKPITDPKGIGLAEHIVVGLQLNSEPKLQGSTYLFRIS